MGKIKNKLNVEILKGYWNRQSGSSIQVCEDGKISFKKHKGSWALTAVWLCQFALALHSTWCSDRDAVRKLQ